MKIYISWSKEKSLEYAKKTKEMLNKINPMDEIFVSESDINGGEDVQKKIITNIRECDKVILCFTNENKKSPWLLFEAGFARGLNKIVIPVLFDEDKEWHSWKDNPMNIVRELNFNKGDLRRCLSECFDFSLNLQNKKVVDDYIKSIDTIREQNQIVPSECEELIENISNNSTFIVNSPSYEQQTAYYYTGFETFDLYKIIIDSFIKTGKYLWIFGRKNTKLFNSNFEYFFEYLHSITNKEYASMSGVDFRCLFLNPESDEVSRAYRYQDSFKDELKVQIKRAKRSVRDNEPLKKSFRYYSSRREEIIIRIDNSIIYSKPHIDCDGFPQRITDSKFEIFSVNSNRGKKYVKMFDDVWKKSIDMF